MSTSFLIFFALLFIYPCYGTSSPLCLRHEFRCSVSGACIPLHWRCDGTPQCSDGTDELNCTSDWKGRCPGDSHRCPNSRCLPGQWACDGQPHCENGTDEDNCVLNPDHCLRNEFRCLDGTCIRGYLRCDNRRDCRGDELRCNGTVCGGGGGHRCGSGRCLSSVLVCDGYPHCDDSSDERDCDKCKNWGCEHGCEETSDGPQCDCRQGFTLDPEDGRTCKRNKCKNWGCAHRCKDTSDGPQCYCHQGFTLDPKDGKTCKQHKCRNWGCADFCEETSDGPQCYCRQGFALDPEDRRTCKRRCLRNEFRCLNGAQCIRQSFRCDGPPDCRDGSDEEGCADRQCPGGRGLKCDGRVCLPDEYACDGSVDCRDRTDEKDCPVPPDGSCTENQFLCLDHPDVPPEGACLPIQWRCMWLYRHCRGYAVACAEPPCNKAHARLCNNGTWCVWETRECDGYGDCEDGSDEQDCYKCEKWGCSQMCTKTSKWPQCHCKSGYELDAKDQRSCKPVPAVPSAVQHPLLDSIPLS